MTVDSAAPPLRLAGKVAVITGIASGQGRAAACFSPGKEQR